MNKRDPINFDQEWQDRYQDMIADPEQAVSHLRSGRRVFVGTGCGKPAELIQAMTGRAGKLTDIEIVHLLTKGEALYANKDFSPFFCVNSFFIGSNVRDAIQEGLGQYTPILLYDIPYMFYSGKFPLDAVLIQVTPPDKRGMVSLGISVDIVKSAAQNGSLVIAEVNPQMPWTLGDSLMDINDIDILVPVDYPILERKSGKIMDVTSRIGEHIAGLIEDGSTIEFGMGRIPGVGRIPQAVIAFLKGKKDLGIHTEMITDSIMELVESGAVTGVRKSTDKGRIVTSFCMGSRKLYDFVNNNPLFSFRPTEYVNDPYVIAKQHKMVSINMALEVDLTGQVCSDSDGTAFYSGIAGQVDFLRGAARSSGGKAIIALSSKDIKKNKSRIVSCLSPGSGVVITRGEVEYVVTEHGVAYLHGKSVQDRALALISIADSLYREQLFNEAMDFKYIRPEFAEVKGKFMIGSQDMKASMLLEDGNQINFRPIHPTDERGIRDLVYALSQETIYFRYMTSDMKFDHRQIHRFVYVDHRKDIAIVGTIPEAYGEDIIVVGRYYLDTKTNRAEVFFVVRDDWQNRGIGSFLFKHLAGIAKKSGIAGFTAEFLKGNDRMQAIFSHSGYPMTRDVSDETYRVRIEFE
ncbi:MAG: GNAT family N-acetyltransferase [Thermodesulfobacteriota bacterium]|nr:GNAT family N-acetyltransferase [Thermodesulfobacteriota bacterium]